MARIADREAVTGCDDLKGCPCNSLTRAGKGEVEKCRQPVTLITERAHKASDARMWPLASLSKWGGEGMGAKGKPERKSECKASAVRGNARRPRGRWANTEERAQLEEAKALLRACLPAGARRLAALLRDPATPADVFLQGFRLAADRAGLPVLQQQELIGDQIQPILLISGGHPKPGDASPAHEEPGHGGDDNRRDFSENSAP